MLDHVGIPVSDFERSKRLYEEALSPLGYELIMEPRHGAAGLGRASRTSGSVKASQATTPYTSPSPPTTVRA